MWAKVDCVPPCDFRDIMSEDLCKTIELEDLEVAKSNSKKIFEDFNFPQSVPNAHKENYCETANTEESDLIIAQMLQNEFDLEMDEEIKLREKHHNKDSKISVSYQNYRMYPDNMLFDSDEKVHDLKYDKDWDRFEKNEKVFAKIGRDGFMKDEDGNPVTKHDANLSGRKNACKVMSLAPELSTGDGGKFDMKISNKVFNELRVHSKKMNKKTNRALDRRENVETSTMGLDEATRMILYKLINNQILESVDGVVSSGKEAIVLHGKTDQTNEDRPGMPEEVAIKIFSQRDRYIKDDFRFKDRFSKSNNKNIIAMWAEKELHNLNRLKKCFIACPEVVILKKHIFIMSFIGEDSLPAPKLKEAVLSDSELIMAYEEIVEIMVKMYNEARLVHADLSEYNILWFKHKCWIIDMAQSVEPCHPSAFELLLRDCANISNFFSKKGVSGVKSKEELFLLITGVDVSLGTTTVLERIHKKDASLNMRDKLSDDGPLKPFPFDDAWSIVEKKKKCKKSTIIEKDIAESLREISVGMN